ncbi:hypothetical protein TheveDRAFT_0085 [Thermanaerovibrio velox DSM 12556]|uniref:DUF4234 domain-containing protein n=1 Tax=Thermanaerovibrio velox DSM 12556 TaxID=926567 RepID=H0UMZ4_9BACT|nr:hypothetical protein TheveDRAFT_0085 [Thermanaerovibrio velox DSM 12556]
METVVVNPRIKRVPLLMMVLLSVVTMGIYPAYWVYSRRDAFNQMGSAHVGDVLGTVPLILGFVSLGFSFKSAISPIWGSMAGGLASLVGAVMMILACFRYRENLRFYVKIRDASPLAAESVARSWFMTLIFGALYLQYHVNRLLDAGLLDPK